MTQAEALDILKTGANVYLTGEPGSGKSYTIGTFVAYLREHGIEPAITASTGIAATHIHGMTIHSWSRIGVKKVLSDYDLDTIASNEYVSRRVGKTKVLIIDEVSMLDGKTLDLVDRLSVTFFNCLQFQKMASKVTLRSSLKRGRRFGHLFVICTSSIAKKMKSFLDSCPRFVPIL
jgi:hypothetical protein